MTKVKGQNAMIVKKLQIRERKERKKEKDKGRKYRKK